MAYRELLLLAGLLCTLNLARGAPMADTTGADGTFKPPTALEADPSQPVPAPENEPPPECIQYLRMMTMTLNLHVRGVGVPDELQERVHDAYLEMFPSLLGITPEEATQAIAAKYGLDVALLAEHFNTYAPFGANMEQKRFFARCDVGAKVAELSDGKVTSEEVFDELMKLFLKGMDPHSSLITGKEAEEFMADATGTMVGIGVILNKETEKSPASILDVMDQGPAAQAGLVAGDEIVGIDTGSERLDTSSMTIGQVVERIVGPEGTEVMLFIRDRAKELRQVVVTRRKFQVQYARGENLGNGVAKISLRSFGEGAAAQIREELEKLGDHRAIILDLRSNPGGLVQEAVRVTDLFIDRGLVLSSWTRGGSVNVYEAKEEGMITRAPMVILVNSHSASAAEIVSQVLSGSDYGRALVVGSRTWGKGSVGRSHSFGSDRILLLTEAIYYTAGGTSPHGKGMTPDLPMEDPVFAMKMAEIRASGKPMPPLHEADLPAAITGTAPLTEEQRKIVGLPSERNDVRSLVSVIPAEAKNVPMVVRDAVLAVGRNVAEVMANLCRDYRVENCAKPAMMADASVSAR